MLAATAKPSLSGAGHCVSTSTKTTLNLVEAAAATACCGSMTCKEIKRRVGMSKAVIAG